MLGISLFHMEEFQQWQTFELPKPVDEFYLDTISIKVRDRSLLLHFSLFSHA